MSNETQTIAAVLNGEIYNHDALRTELSQQGHTFRSHCDTEVIVHAYEQWGSSLCQHLRGMYAFILFDRDANTYLAARDPMGVKPLYWGTDTRGTTFLASEAKALVGFADSAALLPPGHMMSPSGLDRCGTTDSCPPSESFIEAAATLQATLAEAVRLRLPPGLPFGVFLSGGLDSSFLLALAGQARPDVIALSIGFSDSLETHRAASLCRALNVAHESITVSFSQLLSSYHTVVMHLESFEPNLVRASLISYQLAYRARQLGLRVVLTGEGADELFGGYDDFIHLPSASLQAELDKFATDLHRTQLLRWDKMGMAHTVEVRTPYMDQRLVSFANSLPPEFKVRHGARRGSVETKAVLREAARNVLPDDIRLYRKVPMDEGMTQGGAAHWQMLWSEFVASQPTPRLDVQLLSQFHITTEEEMLHLASLLRYLPPQFISTSRVTVRSITLP